MKDARCMYCGSTYDAGWPHSCSEQKPQSAEAYYLHTDDNYYWTPEAWAKYQAQEKRIGELEQRLAECLAEEKAEI